MLAPEILQMLLAQVTIEENSARIYYQIARVCSYLSWDGFACWYYNQAVEEDAHAKKIKDYIDMHGHLVILESVEKPDIVPTSDLNGKGALLTLAQLGFEHEGFVTSSLQKISEASLLAADFATLDLMHWFMKEQAEEEDKFGKLVTKLRYAGEDTAALFELDEHYGKEE